MSVGVDGIFESVSLSVCCLFVSPQRNSKSSDPNVFKLGVGNELGIPSIVGLFSGIQDIIPRT